MERLADTFRQGKAPEVVRRKALEGDLPVPGAERIEILTILARDKDEATRKHALQTLLQWDAQDLREVLASPVTPVAILDFAVNYLAPTRADLLEGLLENPGLPDDLREEIRNRLLEEAKLEIADAPAAPRAAHGKDLIAGEGVQRETLIQRINRMSAVEKIKLALTGNQESRLILIRDSNKLVARSVLQSPKVMDAEVEAYASAKNVSEEVLRLIAMNRAYIKNYAVARSLVNNPRAPLDVSLPLINRMNDKDLKLLTTNRNIPETIRTMAIKLVKQKEQALKPKIPTGHK
ncbi:MAG: hypothetical protein LAP13_01400 [Acidobacteriia bacterium]|nr:hypothetical protein [Terriglobia bacterium]